MLLVGLTARYPTHWPYYVIMAAIGSVLGCWFTYWVSRKGGEEGLEKHVSKRRLAYVQAQVEKHGATALVLASLMPPPFPFTPFVMVAGALKFPAVRLLAIVGCCRVIRFATEALLAKKYGTHILQIAQTPVVQGIVLAVVVLSIAGSAYSLYQWAKGSRRRSV